eukprot:m.6703 g.6703  ORF g.6703 m.6703 type:complete len:237 (-) comp2637_c0_seq1:135-845(-)
MLLLCPMVLIVACISGVFCYSSNSSSSNSCSSLPSSSTPPSCRLKSSMMGVGEVVDVLFGKGVYNEIRNLSSRQLLFQILNFVLIVLSALMIWKGMVVALESESPIVVVLSGSMEPAFQRGDLLFLSYHKDIPIRVGEIIVFKVNGRDIPIVHRIIKVHEDNDGNVKFLTKGDNNRVDDRGLYAPGQMWLSPEDVIGRAEGFAPYVGMVTIIMNDFPALKFVMLIVLAVIAIIHRE